jgi:hypothetical protein
MKRPQRKPRRDDSKSTVRIPKPALETFSLASFAGMAAIEEGRKASRRRR